MPPILKRFLETLTLEEVKKARPILEKHEARLQKGQCNRLTETGLKRFLETFTLEEVAKARLILDKHEARLQESQVHRPTEADLKASAQRCANGAGAFYHAADCPRLIPVTSGRRNDCRCSLFTRTLRGTRQDARRNEAYQVALEAAERLRPT